MSQNITDAMKAKTKIPKTVDLEEFRDLRYVVDDLMSTTTSVQLLLKDVLERVDFEPPILAEFRKAQIAISETSRKMSETAICLNTQVKRIEMASVAVLEQRIAHVRKMIAAGVLLSGLPSTVAVALLAWRAGLL